MVASVAQSLSAYTRTTSTAQASLRSRPTERWRGSRPARVAAPGVGDGRSYGKGGPAADGAATRLIRPLTFRRPHITRRPPSVRRHREDPRELNVWIYNLADGRFRPAIHDGEAQWPAWSPDGRLFFNWLRAGGDRWRSYRVTPTGVFLRIPGIGTAFHLARNLHTGRRTDRSPERPGIVVVTFGNGQTRIEPVHKAQG